MEQLQDNQELNHYMNCRLGETCTRCNNFIKGDKEKATSFIKEIEKATSFIKEVEALQRNNDNLDYLKGILDMTRLIRKYHLRCTE